MQLINKVTFRHDVLGSHVPEVVSERVFCCFASQISIAGQGFITRTGKHNPLGPSTVGNSTESGPQVEGMSLEDLLHCYCVLKGQDSPNMAALTFELLKLSKE